MHAVEPVPESEGIFRDWRCLWGVTAAAGLANLVWFPAAGDAGRSAAGVVLGALMAGLVYRLGRRLGAGAVGATATALAAASGTALWGAARGLIPDLVVAFAITFAASWALEYRWFPRGQSLLASAVGVSAAVLVRPTCAFLLPVLFVYVFGDPRRRMRPQLGRMAVFVAPSAAAVVWVFLCGHSPSEQWLHGVRANGPSTATATWGSLPVLMGLAVTVGLIVGAVHPVHPPGGGRDGPPHVRRRQRDGLLLLALPAAAWFGAIVSPDAPTGSPISLEAVSLLIAPAGILLRRTRAAWPAWLAFILLTVGGAALQVHHVLLDGICSMAWWNGRPGLLVGLTALAILAAVRALLIAARHDRFTTQ
jgi:hypothetical protein